MKRFCVRYWLSITLVSGAAVCILLIGFTPAGQRLAWVALNRLHGDSTVSADALHAAQSRLRQAVGDDELVLPLPDARIVIDKSERRLSLYDGERLIKTYRVGLGSHSEGDKQREGDRRTPTGNYHVCTRLKRSQYHLFLGLNYPNADDARIALSENHIGAELAAELERAEKNHKQPAWDTALGGAIGIHGGGCKYDWTLGCIALEDFAIEELWVSTRYWTPVRIEE
ncbi:L,D-transpeptidase family protein [Candidatus Sumerlaeota bacterium]|nr:L,D-transpeptidase family protein [Candidatus Sumerlaeota bacterium]